MKKYSNKLISFALVVMMSITMFIPVLANGEISVYLDNEKVQFDVAPLLVNGRTMVPMRAIFEKLGAVVYWDNNTRTAIAQKGNVNVSISIDDTTLYNNGEPIVLDVPAQLNGGRTLVPLRAVSEAFDCDVQWNGNTKTVQIFSIKTVSGQQKVEAINELIIWINNNTNCNSSSGAKSYEHELNGHKIEIIPIVGTFEKSLNIIYQSSGQKYMGVTIFMLKSRFSGSYIDQVSKTYNSAEGNIIKSNILNSLELNCDWYTGSYTGDQNVLIEKYQEMVSISIKLFDDFLKSNNIGLTLKDFDLDYDLSSVALNNNQTTTTTTPSVNTQTNTTTNNNYQGGGTSSATSKITLSSFPLYLYADDGTGTFLGNINSNQYDRESIANQYGDYGSQYKTKSIFNQYGDYGSKYSQYSVFNEYATHPPKILDKNGKVVGYLTANKYIRDAISYEEMMVLLKKFNK